VDDDRAVVQERGPAAYLAEFLGTLMLVLFVTLAVSIFAAVPSAQDPNPFIDWTLIGLVHVFVLLILVQTLAVVCGAHFNPAITAAMAALRQISPADAGIYILVQLLGALAGAFITKLLLTELPNAEAVSFGAVELSGRIAEKESLGMLAEFIGTFLLVFAIVGVALNPRVDRAIGPLVIGAALGLGVMVMGPLTGAGFNPARAFGAAVAGDQFGGLGNFLLVYVLAPALGALAAAFAYFNIFITPGKKGMEGMDPVG
jgi:glycerol uptake facilitator protein